ncbi:hypothetical protein GBA52_012179 [Prunus armeniaca]|nr:hypothetical protein GBA52_012179 [Prunus armeniaca]
MDVRQDIVAKIWRVDVNNPASAEGFTVVFTKASFTVIFTKARDQMSSGAPGTGTPSSKPEPNSQYLPREKVVLLHVKLSPGFGGGESEML